MGTIDQARRHWKRIIASKEPRREVQRGILGDGDGNVRLTSRPDYVYCRVKSAANAVWQVINTKVADVDELPVLIEKMQTGNNWQVIDVDIPMLTNVADGWAGEKYLPAHARSHEWPDGDPGMDVVDVHPRALTPLRCYPKNTTELKVRFAPLRYTYGGDFKTFPGGELDLSSYQPSSGQARYVLTYLDPRDNLPYAVFGDVEADATPMIPPTPDIPPYAVLSSLVRLDGDQTYFPDSDFVDHRDILNVLTPDQIDDLSDVEIHDLANNQVLVYDTASEMWVNANQSGGGVTDAEYLVLTLDGTLTDERRFVDGAGLTGTDGGAGGDYTVDLDIDSLDAEATADDADTIAIHDDTAGAIKKQTRANFLSDKAPKSPQYLVLSYDSNLSAERLFALKVAKGLKGTDAGADDSYEVELDIDGLVPEATTDDADTIAIYDDSAGAIRKQTRANFAKGYPFNFVTVDATDTGADYTGLGELDTAFGAEGAATYAIGLGQFTQVNNACPDNSYIFQFVRSRSNGILGTMAVGSVTYGLNLGGDAFLFGIYVKGLDTDDPAGGLYVPDNAEVLNWFGEIVATAIGGTDDAYGIVTGTNCDVELFGGSIAVSSAGGTDYGISAGADTNVYLNGCPQIYADTFFTGDGTFIGIFQDFFGNLYEINGAAGTERLINSFLKASDGAPDPAWSVDADGNLTTNGGTLDLDGVADALILDGDGDTTISAPTDDQIDFETGNADRMTLTNSGLALQAGSRVNDIRTSVAASDNTHLVTEGAVYAHTNATSNVHGLPSNVHVLGHRVGSGRYIQQNTVSITTANSFTPYRSASDANVTYPVAFSSAPNVQITSQTNATAVCGVKSVTTTGFATRGFTVPATTFTAGWVAFGS